MVMTDGYISRVLLVVGTVLSLFVLAASHIGPPGYSPDCPVTVDAPDQAVEGMSVVFSAHPTNYQHYNWSITSGQIVSGQGTASITVMNLSAGSSCTASVEILNHGCRSLGSATVTVQGFPAPSPIRFAAYGDVKFGSERELFDKFAIELQRDPTIDGHILSYGTCKLEGMKRANRVRDYLTRIRNIDPRRLSVADGGCMRVPKTELWIVPKGAKNPEAETDRVSPCPECRYIPGRRRARRGR